MLLFSFDSGNVQTAAEDGVKLWDLRKLRNFRSFSSADANSGTQLLYPVPGPSRFVDTEISM